MDETTFPTTAAATSNADVLDSPDVRHIKVGARDIYLVGTAHVSRESAELVQRAIEKLQPDRVCIELDAARLTQLRNRDRFEKLDLKQVIRQQQLAPLLLNLLLVSYQQKLGGKLGVLPGSEFVAAVETAEKSNIPIVLCDRDVKITLRRAWGALSWTQCFMLMTAVLSSAFETPELSEDDLRRLREQDVVSHLVEELGRQLPGVTTVLISERDKYLAAHIRAAAGQRLVAVVGAGHVDGIQKLLESGAAIDLSELETVPPVSSLWHWLGWGMPAAILGAIGLIGWRHGVDTIGSNLLFWIVITGVPSMIATALAAAHPLTSLSALVAAPITTLTPVLGVGYVTAFVEAYLRPPRVYELRSAAQDVGVARKWWTNRLLRILLIFILSSIGGSAGMLVGSAEIIRGLWR